MNSEGTLLATLKEDKLLINFESVFSYPQNTDLFIAIPSMQKMQGNIVLDVKDLNTNNSFEWKERDKDNLHVKGSISIKKK